MFISNTIFHKNPNRYKFGALLYISYLTEIKYYAYYPRNKTLDILVNFNIHVYILDLGIVIGLGLYHNVLHVLL